MDDHDIPPVPDLPTPRPPKKLKKLKYTSENVKKALEAISKGTSLRAAAQQFQVPKSTLYDVRNGKYSHPGRLGRNPTLTDEEESRIKEWIFLNAHAGFPVIEKDVLDCVQKIMTRSERVTSFKDGRPGSKWFAGFLRRHKDVSQRIPEKLSLPRAYISEKKIRKWFQETTEYFEQENICDIFEDPCRIFNMDETGFLLCPQTKKVLCPMGVKNAYEISSASDKECITVLVSAQATGEYVPPLIIYPYVRVPNEIRQSVPQEWAIGASKSGWINSELFFEYIANCFYPWIKEKRIPLPVCVFVDGHRSHLSIPLSEFCIEKKIVLVALPPNATHILQPLDVSVFYPLKCNWRDKVREFRLAHNIETVVGRIQFGQLLAAIFLVDASSINITSGFRKCGIFPWTPEAVDYSKCVRDKAREASRSTNSDLQGGNTSPFSDSDNALAHLLQYIDEDTSSLFHETHENNAEWTGDISYRFLYEYFKHLKSLGQNVTVIHTEENVSGSPLHAQASSEENVTDDRAPNSPSLLESFTENENDFSLNNDELPDVPETTVNTSSEQCDKVNTPLQERPKPSNKTPEIGESPFKVCKWPSKPSQPVPGAKRKINLPPVLTSKVWLNEKQKEQAEKEKKEAEKAERKRIREEKKKERESMPKPKKRLPPPPEESSSEEDVDDPPVLDDSDDSLHLMEISDDDNPAVINLEKEKYYAVYYDLTYYIGRYVEDEMNDAGEKTGRVKIKFLKEVMPGIFRWPKPEDLQFVEKKFLFYGPIYLKGHEPFIISTRSIYAAYKKFKV